MVWVLSRWFCVYCGQIEMAHARAHVLQQKYERIGHILAVVTSVVAAQIGGTLKVPVGIPLLGKSHSATIAMMHPGAMETSSTVVQLLLSCHPVANQSGTIHGISTNSTTRSRCGRASLLPCRLIFYVFFAKFL